MDIDSEIIDAAERAGADHGVRPAALLAVALVETDATAHARFDGRREPLIRFEGHYFDRRLSAADRITARAAGLSDPRVGAIANPRSQAGRWRLYERAAAIDAQAAAASVSWGLCQVMGAHWERLGFVDARALAKAARRDAEGQFAIGAAFLALGRLDRLLAVGDVTGFARLYNGPGFRRNRYDRKIAQAWRRARALMEDESEADETLRLGATGPAIAALQAALVETGAEIAVDGIFGPRTGCAVAVRQATLGLAATGQADADFRAALAEDAGLIGPGDRGEGVTDLQAALAGAGYDLAADGIFGPRTSAALRAYQAAADLTATGFLGEATRRRLAL